MKLQQNKGNKDFNYGENQSCESRQVPWAHNTQLVSQYSMWVEQLSNIISMNACWLALEDMHMSATKTSLAIPN